MGSSAISNQFPVFVSYCCFYFRFKKEILFLYFTITCRSRIILLLFLLAKSPNQVVSNYFRFEYFDILFIPLFLTRIFAGIARILYTKGQCKVADNLLKSKCQVSLHNTSLFTISRS